MAHQYHGHMTVQCHLSMTTEDYSCYEKPAWRRTYSNQITVTVSQFEA